MNRSRALALLFIAALVTGYTLFAAATVQANTHPSKAEQQAEALHIAIIWTAGVPCGHADAVGCYTGGGKIVVLEGMSAADTEFVIYHELGHVISKRLGLGWNDCEADQYAVSMGATFPAICSD